MLNDFDDERRLVFFEVIQDSLRVKDKSDLFNWLQRGFHYLVPHEFFVYGVRDFDRESFDFNYFTSTLNFTDKEFKAITNQGEGLFYEAYKNWQNDNMPVFLTSDLPSKVYKDYSVINVSETGFHTYKLNHLLVHGFFDKQRGTNTIVMLGRVNAPVNNLYSCLIQLLMPILHCLLIKVLNNSFGTQPNSTQHPNLNAITKRELEVLIWVNKGKTNWEISSILGISHTTVKNHVQNIIRKLGVENRRQAAIKGLGTANMSINK